MRIAQIIAFYFDWRRRGSHPAYRKDPLFYLKTQLKNADSISTSIKDYIFVFNVRCSHCEGGLLDGAKSLIDDHAKKRGYNTQVIFRDNIDASYGAWDQALSENKDKYDYSLLLEDDYMPAIDNYEKKLLDYFNEDDVFYVCGASSRTTHPALYDPPIASISYGMIDNKIYNKCDGFQLRRGGVHKYNDFSSLIRIAEWNQRYFLRPWLDANYKMKDIADKYQTPFLDSSRMKYLGKEGGEALFVPIYPPYA